MAGMFPSSVISSVSSSDEISVTVSSITSVTFEKIESISLHGAMGGQPLRSVWWILHLNLAQQEFHIHGTPKGGGPQVLRTLFLLWLTTSA